VYDDSLGVSLVVQSSSEAMVENTATVSSPFFDPDTTNNRVTVATAIAVAIDEVAELPSDYQLEQNYPNPFSATTFIQYAVPAPAHVSLSVFDVLGRRVSVLVDGAKPAGTHRASFNAAGLPNGLYFYRLTADGFSQTRTMVLLR
ncbi:MAG: T9SS type A sorting domain-containing protein, partial [Kiloniellales bacterium]